MTTIEDANFALKKVLDAGSQKNVIEWAWIKNVRVTIPRVIVTLSLPSFANSQRDRIVQEVRKVLLDFEDIDDVQIEIDNNPSKTESQNQSSTSEKFTPACSKIEPFFKTLDLPPPPSSLSHDSSINFPLPSTSSSPEQILSCRVNKRFLVFSLEFFGGSFNMYLVNLEEKNFFG